MRKDIHPQKKEVTATCSCGNIMQITSSLDHDISLDICYKCHPFYTGKQKNLDTSGRISKFKNRFGAKKLTNAL